MEVNKNKIKPSLPGMFLQGMTLVEVLIAVAIFGIVMVAVAAFEVNVFSYKGSITSSYETTQSAQIMLKTMLSELRETQTAANGSYPILQAGSTTLSFYSDSDNDTVVERITYSYSGSILYRAVIRPSGFPSAYNPDDQSTTTLLTNIRNGQSVPLFEYFDTDYTGTSSPLAYPISIRDIKLVKINVSLDVDERRSPVPVVYSVQASFRNLKNNL